MVRTVSSANSCTRDEACKARCYTRAQLRTRMHGAHANNRVITNLHKPLPPLPLPGQLRYTKLRSLASSSSVLLRFTGYLLPSFLPIHPDNVSVSTAIIKFMEFLVVLDVWRKQLCKGRDSRTNPAYQVPDNRTRMRKCIIFAILLKY